MVAGFKSKPPRIGHDDAWSRAQFLALETRLAMIEAFLENSVAYGGMRILTTRIGGPITAAWQPIAPYDALTVEAIGCEFDLLAGTFKVRRPGVWRLSIFFEILVNQSGVVREMDFRLVNADTGLQVGAGFLVEVTSRISSIGFTGVYDLSGLEGIPIRLEVSAPDVTFTTGDWLQQNIGLDYAGALPSRSYAAAGTGGARSRAVT